MRISDWSSDVCSSDLLVEGLFLPLNVEEGRSFDKLRTNGKWEVRRIIRSPWARRKSRAAAPVRSPAHPCGDLRRSGGRRSEERRVGKEGVTTCRSRWSLTH